ncbi:MAG: RnfABCDGE type electron transport complex subunit D [Bacteroidota bacterium]|nr:RnfABCDGE type electron transport complex subunit D [Bacteroidota bacterium]
MQYVISLLRQPAWLSILQPFRNAIDWFKSDARHYQILFQLSFLLYGIFALNWEIPLMRFNIVILTCLSIQSLFIILKTKDWTGLKSALITAFSLCLMLAANSTWTFILAAVLGISSKFFIKINGKHIFNPANFGIMITLMITGDAWISPGQWGSNALLLMLVGCTGLVVLLKVKRLDTAFAFLIAFLGLSFIRNILYLGWPLDFFWHQFSTGSLLLFTFFMITDPMSTPSSRPARIIWALLVGALTWYISTKLFVHTAPLWALFVLSPLIPVFDRIFRAEKFKWLK